MLVLKALRVIIRNCRTIHVESIKNSYKKPEDIKNVKFARLCEDNSKFIKLYRMTFKENDKEKIWDLIDTHNSVLILIYNVTRHVLVFVKQFRASVYSGQIPTELHNQPIDVKKYPRELGMCIELCAGTVDKNKPLVEVAKEEVLEECGYDVPLKNFELIQHYYANVGICGRLTTVYYCEVTDKMKISEGGGVGNEVIEVIEMKPEEVEKLFIKPIPGSTIIGYCWFMKYKYKLK